MMVQIDTSVEIYPAVQITAPEHDVSGVIPPKAFRWEVPDHLYIAYRSMVEGLDAIETAILQPLGFTQDRDGKWNSPS